MSKNKHHKQRPGNPGTKYWKGFTPQSVVKVPAYIHKHIQRSAKQEGDLRLPIPAEIFAQVISWTADSRPAETSGWGWIEDGILTDVYRNVFAQEQGGGVTWSMAEIMAVCDMKEKEFCNFQWHSHPGFSAFFSATDDKSNDLLLDDLFKVFENGSFYIGVQNGGMEWLLRRYEWEQSGEILRHQDGCFTLHGVALTPGPTFWSLNGLRYPAAKKTKADKELDDLFSGKPLTPQSPWLEEEDGWNVLFPRESAVLDHSAYQDVPSGSEVDGDYIFFSAQEERAYMGDWSSNREDYRELFTIFKVQPYDWEQLFDAIEDEFPDSYYLIVSESQPGWGLLDVYFKKQQEEESYDQPF